MKITLRFVCLLFCFFLQGQLLANTVIVKGYVKDSANNAIANKKVKIYSTDSTTGACAMYHTVTTNPNGYYTDTLSCSGDIRKLLVIVENCNGNNITRDPNVGTNNIVEVNFVICVANPTPVPVTCKPAFQYTSTTAGIKFNSNGSTTVSGDSIISRTWNFGDSTAAVTGNIVDPTHAYAKPGSYNVCLTIKTKKGCENTYCQTVVFTPASNECKVEAIITFEKITARKFRFNSAQSNTLVGDSIVQRIWKFSDGSSLDGNQVNPLKEFKDTGVYTICVRLRTVKGCEKEFCINLVVRDSVPGTIPVPVNCKAQFTFSIQGKTVKFNSANSSAPTGDSIISRNWIFGDTSVPLTGNRVDPSHVYAKAGKYTACLYIKTKSGCESKICADFTLVDSVIAPPTNCKAQVTFTTQGKTVKFNSANSSAPAGDSIISRNWVFGDTSAVLSGNRVDPSHVYAKAGTYTACLYIKTKNGCESKICVDFSLRDSITTIPTNCKATFTYTFKDSTVYFNSAASVGTSADDSIISRTWYYSDNNTSVSLGGNVIAPFYKYATPGTYTVYLMIKTKKGCESKFSAQVIIPAPPVLTNCKALFTYSTQAGTVKFNSAGSKGTTEKDSIISRVWLFGDSSVPMQGNIIDPLHNYTKPGKYTVTLYIKTKSGCESKYAETVTIGTLNCKVEVDFTAERVSLKKVQFNSSMTNALYGDSIIQRNWKFGDNSVLSGNEIKPVKEFPVAGIYNTCLQVRTRNGCEAQVCKPVTVQDTITTPQTNVNFVKIISINPNPVVTRMLTTIYSRNTNVEVDIAIYDIYGIRKMTVKKLLAQGNNVIEINTEFLYRGPYFLKVSSKNSIDSKAFYKL